MIKPKTAYITLKFPVPMEGWDEDVDWVDAISVIKEQYECCGIWHLCGCSGDDGEIISIEVEN